METCRRATQQARHGDHGRIGNFWRCQRRSRRGWYVTVGAGMYANHFTSGSLRQFSGGGEGVFGGHFGAVTTRPDFTIMVDSSSSTLGYRLRHNGASHHVVVAR